MKRHILFGLIFLAGILGLQAQDNLLVDCIHGANYSFDNATGLPEAIDFQQMLPQWEVDLFQMEDIQLDTVVIDEEIVNTNIDYVLYDDIPIYYPPTPATLYVLVEFHEMDEFSMPVTGAIQNASGEVLTEMFMGVAHYDDVSGEEFQVSLEFHEYGEYHIRIGYGLPLFTTDGVPGQIDISQYDAMLRIRDEYYFVFLGISPEYSSLDMTALSEAFSNGLGYFGVCNLYDGMMDKPIVHFDTPVDTRIDFAVDTGGLPTVVFPQAERNRGSLSWKNLAVKRNDDNEILYEAVMPRKLDFIEFDNLNGNPVMTNRTDETLHDIWMFKRDVDGLYRLGVVESLAPGERRPLRPCAAMTAGDAIAHIDNDFFEKAVSAGLNEEEAQDFIRQYHWIRSLFGRAYQNPDHWFAFYRFDESMYDRLLPMQCEPAPQHVSRDMWVMVSNIREREDVYPLLLEPNSGSQGDVLEGLRMREYGVIDEYYTRDSREFEFFGYELNEHVMGWMLGPVQYYTNQLAMDIMEGAEVMNFQWGVYNFNIPIELGWGILYEQDNPDYPIVAGSTVWETPGRIIMMGSSEPLSPTDGHPVFMQNAMHALLYSSVFGPTGIEDDTVLPAGNNLQATPNPFNPMTLIRYSIGQPGPVRLDVYNILGQRVKNLMKQTLDSGVYQVEWDGRDQNGNPVSSGVYFLRMNTAHEVTSRKILLLK